MSHVLFVAGYEWEVSVVTVQCSRICGMLIKRQDDPIFWGIIEYNSKSLLVRIQDTITIHRYGNDVLWPSLPSGMP
ncbi:hypothetical protein TNCV_3798341 [Trichonephila clavipes]|nr:hypothetical protein TNCV_3798341 [Trichonephila clavipes]